jgi:hypothetical protein
MVFLHEGLLEGFISYKKSDESDLKEVVSMGLEGRWRGF